jgi:integrase
MTQQRKRVKLNERSVSSLPAPDPSGKQVITWDSELRGFCVMCSGTSNVKTFQVKGTIRVNGRSVSMPRKAIGRYGVFTVEQARIKAKEMLYGYASGVDPRAQRSSGITLKEAMEDFLRTREATLRPKSVKGYRADMKYLESWSDVPLRDISREMVEARHRAIAEEVAERSGNTGKALANKVMRSLRGIYNFHLDRVPTMPPNPVRLKKMWNTIKPRERHLKGDEFRKFYAALYELPNEVGRDLIILLMFCGLRLMEAAKLKWDRVDLERKMFTIPAEDTKANRKLELPMCDIVFDMLKARRALGKTEYVFFSHSASGHIVNPNKLFDRIAETSGVRISAHDLRRSYLTTGESCDVLLLTLASLANQRVPGVTAQYIQPNVERLREPAQRIADKLKELCGI